MSSTPSDVEPADPMRPNADPPDRPQQGPIALRNSRFSIGILPRLGGAVTHFVEHRREGVRHWLRAAAAATLAGTEAGEAALFLLVPVSGRIRDAQVTFGGRTETIPRNVTSEDNYLHGEAWQAPWSVVHQADDRATLRLDGPVAGWPWPYRAQVDYRLLQDGLSIGLALTNTGEVLMPAGIGLHPWFPAGPAMLQAEARTLWRIDDRKLFVEKLPVPARWDFTQGRPLTGTDLEHGFSGWDGAAAVWWTDRPGRLLIRASESLRHLVVYTRDLRGDFCVEPVSHAVDGFNLFAAGVTDTGTVVLAPGQTLEGTATFTVAD